MNWTSKELVTLKRLYPDTATERLAKRLKHHTLSAVYQAARRMGLRKSKAFKVRQARKVLLKAGATFRFKKGQLAWNKGKHYQPGGRAKETQFTKGNVPLNTYKPVGSRRIAKDGETEIKVADPNVWKREKEIVWEQTYGPVPKGMILRCKDGNPQNVLIRNLELITRAENMERNSIHRYPRELKFAIRVAKRLNREIERHEERH